MKIAIQGHPTRGNEVIQILESLGGKNTNHLHGNNCDGYYCILGDNHITSIFSILGHKVYTLEEFEKEFPFKIGDKVISLITGLIGTIIKFSENGIYHFKYDNGISSFASASYLKLYKEMKKERNIKLTLEKAKEWYKKGGELREIALQAFTERELNPLPRSWEEFCKYNPIKKGECILESEDRISIVPCDVDHRMYKNLIPSKKSAKAHLALIQLEQLRNCWRKGWEPEYRSTNYAVKRSNNEIHVIQTYSVSAFLSFPTRDMAKEFLECFKDLIELARDLI